MIELNSKEYYFADHIKRNLLHRQNLFCVADFFYFLNIELPKIRDHWKKNYYAYLNQIRNFFVSVCKICAIEANSSLAADTSSIVADCSSIEDDIVCDSAATR